MPRDELLYGPKTADQNRSQFAYVTAKLVKDGGDEFEGGFSYLITDTYDQTSAPGETQIFTYPIN